MGNGAEPHDARKVCKNFAKNREKVNTIFKYYLLPSLLEKSRKFKNSIYVSSGAPDSGEY